MTEAGGSPASDEVKPYKIHKLELSRTPHRPLFPTKSYSWRDTESSSLNTIPQFRTALTPPDSQTPVRIHFVPVRSEGDDATRKRLFRVVIPSIPGTASSDPLPPQLFSASTASTTPAADNKADPVAAVAALFDALMRRLGYERYLVGATAPSSASITARGGRRRGGIDERIVRRLARRYGHEHGVSSSSSLSSCVGAHIVSPVLRAPRVWAEGGAGTGPVLEGFGPEYTLSYALCDSPVGMLAFILKGLRLAAGIGGDEKKTRLTKDELISLVNLMWLPGPEGMLRFWAACDKHWEEEDDDEDGFAKEWKPNGAITVFTGSSKSRKEQEPHTEATMPDGQETGFRRHQRRSRAGRCAIARRHGHCPLFEVPDALFAGVRGLAEAVLAKEPRLATAARSQATGTTAAGPSQLPAERA
ncbi:hypothetical protein L209DRAFT_761062 [Thermothelomyces heterothallicus CBS 203.75]